MASPVPEGSDPLAEAIGALLAPLLDALSALDAVERHLHPPKLPALAAQAADKAAPLRAGLAQFEAVAFPPYFEQFKERFAASARYAAEAIDTLAPATADADGALRACRALGAQARALQALYPVARMLPAVSRFFLPLARRGDAALLARLANADAERAGVGLGAFQRSDADAGYEAGRGDVAVYVPEYYDPATPWPLIVALHGGVGSGSGFLWTWLADARARGAIVLAPTAIGETWSLTGRDIDTPNIHAAVEHACKRWNIDAGRMLLTGVSDGGTFCYVSGLRPDSPFTHLAPCAATFHPLLLDVAPPTRLAALPVYLLHGELDWMFPAEQARTAQAALEAAGARVVYRQRADLSHAWPHDENPRILDWLLG